MESNSNYPDHSNYLAHFTKSRQASVPNNPDNPGARFKGVTARDRLISILEQKTILASTMPQIKLNAVCFTECPWSSLITHAEYYSPFGVGFTKPHVFAAGGGPAFYVRPDHYAQQQWQDSVRAFVTPFWPSYRTPKQKKNAMLLKNTHDYSKEREWRVAHDFKFEYSQISFVVVGSHEDMDHIPHHLKNCIGLEKFLIMNVYKKIEGLWPAPAREKVTQ